MRLVSLIVCVVALSACSSVPTTSAIPARSGSTGLAPAGTGFKTVYQFSGTNGAKPFSPLLYFNGMFYGTTLFGGNSSACGNEGCGTIVSVTRSGTENVLYSFQGNADGENPFGSLVKLNGVFYGTTQAGGANNDGTVYAITQTGVEHIVYSFKGYPSDGQGPLAGLMVMNAKLYGTTEKGGSSGYGTVFSITPKGKETVLYSFAGEPDGASPRSTLLNVGGVLYGTTQYGGNDLLCIAYNPNGCGTVFSVTVGGQETVLHNFTGQVGLDGSRPQAGLVVLGSNTLYGTTFAGGVNNAGSIFKITTGGQESLLYSFGGPPDGANPLAGVTAYNGALFGATSAGGVQGCDPADNGCGTVFSVTTGGVERVLHAFQTSAEGEAPVGGLTLGQKNLFGTASEGGIGCAASGPGCGTVFRILP